MTALKMVQKHENLEKVLESMKDTKYQIPDPFPFDEARRLFKGASVQPPVCACSFKSLLPPCVMCLPLPGHALAMCDVPASSSIFDVTPAFSASQPPSLHRGVCH